MIYGPVGPIVASFPLLFYLLFSLILLCFRFFLFFVCVSVSIYVSVFVSVSTACTRRSVFACAHSGSAPLCVVSINSAKCELKLSSVQKSYISEVASGRSPQRRSRRWQHLC